MESVQDRERSTVLPEDAHTDRHGELKQICFKTTAGCSSICLSSQNSSSCIFMGFVVCLVLTTPGCNYNIKSSKLLFYIGGQFTPILVVSSSMSSKAVHILYATEEMTQISRY